MAEFSFTVLGVPEPQGSIRSFMSKKTGKPALTGDNKDLKPWRQQIGWMALDAMKQNELKLFPRETAIELYVWFQFQKPKSAKKAVQHKTTKPDIDKLGRGILDALTGIVYVDDSQVVRLHLSKNFSDVPMAEISVHSL